MSYLTMMTSGPKQSNSSVCLKKLSTSASGSRPEPCSLTKSWKNARCSAWAMRAMWRSQLCRHMHVCSPYPTGPLDDGKILSLYINSCQASRTIANAGTSRDAHLMRVGYCFAPRHPQHTQHMLCRMSNRSGWLFVAETHT